MSTVASDNNSGPSLHAAIFQYFRWLSLSSSSSSATETSSSLGKTERDPPIKKGNKVLAALMEEFPEELQTIASAAEQLTPAAPWVPDLKVRFDAYPLHMRRLEFVENRLADQQRQKYSATRALPTAAKRTTNALGSTKRKDSTPALAAPANATPPKKRKDPPPTVTTTTKSPKKRKLSSPSLPAASVAASCSNPVGTNATEAQKQQPASQTLAVVAANMSALNEEKKAKYWEERYQQLLHFQRGYGHCRVPSRYPDVPGLGRWVQEQRAIYRVNPTCLEPELVAKLNDIGFEWLVKDPNLPTKSWDDRLEELKEFRRVHGNTRVPRAYKPDPSLGEWVHTQRNNFRTRAPALMDSDRLSRLQAVGFEFKAEDGKKSWEERFEQLAEFRRAHGHVHVPLPEKRMVGEVEGTKDNEEGEASIIQKKQNDEDYRFADWVRKQKLCFWKYQSGDRKNSDLTRARFQKLQDIGFCGRDEEPNASFANKQSRGKGKGPPLNHDTWNLRMDQLRTYKERFGDSEVPGVWPENRQLGCWVQTQRKAYRKFQAGETSHLTAARRAELEGLGFQWILRPNQLKENRKNKEEKDDLECEESCPMSWAGMFPCNANTVVENGTL